MRQATLFLPRMVSRGEVPVVVRFLGKLVIEVLPAALASIIGAFLFAHYQFGQPAALGVAAARQTALPASAEMLQLVREEHAMVRDFVVAERTAEERRAEAADAADARAAADARLADAVIRPAAPQAADKPAPGRARPKVVAAATGLTSTATARLPTVLVASAAPAPAFPPEPAPLAAPAPVSFVSRTLGASGHVLDATLHTVMAIGGIPSWIGHRVDAMDLDIHAPTANAAF